MAEEVFPIIDLSSFGSDPKALTEQVVKACTEWGFMILTGHGISLPLVDRMFTLHQEFCQLPYETKAECYQDERQLGYSARNGASGVSESMAFGGVKGDVHQGKNIPSWWDQPKRAEVETFKAGCHKLACELLRCFATHFGLPADYFADAHRPELYPGAPLRMLHYPKLGDNPTENIPRLGVHTDYSSLTFVFTQNPGLEVEAPSGKWIQVPVVAGGLVCNIGDYMAIWSGKTFKSTLHRISFENLPFDQERWSMAFFMNANSEARLHVLQKTSDGKLMPQPGGVVLTAGDYHQARLYRSRARDPDNSWAQNIKKDHDFMKMVDYVEGLDMGVANGSVKVSGRASQLVQA